jgi:divalent metal cation (Fe/Co/Zn/Cd) transporter
VGILGIGFGLWWADSIAALVIGVDVARGGWKNTRTALRELIDGQPTVVDGSSIDPLRARLQTELLRLDWVNKVLVRVRDEGHVFLAEALVVPETGSVSGEQIEAAVDMSKGLDWRLLEMSVTPVMEIEADSLDDGSP